MKKGKKHYSEAIENYTKAINQGVLSDSETSILFSNRAHVNLLLGNYRRALTDAEEAIRLCSDNVKVRKALPLSLYLIVFVIGFIALIGCLPSCEGVIVVGLAE